jgi:hypothetical protein
MIHLLLYLRSWWRYPLSNSERQQKEIRKRMARLTSTSKSRASNSNTRREANAQK